MTGAGSIGAGGFGCVFLPALKCDGEHDPVNNTHDPSVKYVTKLLTNEHAETEFALIRTFEKRLRSIPNYADYFLVANVTKCRPSKLTRRDLHNYDKQCKPLIKKGITRKNINKSLHKVTAILVPYGGKTIDVFVTANANSRDHMNQLFKSMQSLLMHGILPMNALNMHHGDVKSSNIMIRDGKSRLIDWGLAFDRDDTVNKGSHRRPDRMATKRPFQFNLPPSCILFNDTARAEIEKCMKSGEREKDATACAREIVDQWNEMRGEGSISLLNTIYGHLVPEVANHFGIEYAYAKTKKSDTAPDFAVRYIANILTKYASVDDNRIESEYYQEVYLLNLDVWGFVVSFTVLLSILHANLQTLDDTD